MKPRGLLLILLLLACWGAVFCRSGSADGEGGDTGVLVVRSAGSEPGGGVLRPGDILRAGKDGPADAVFPDGTALVAEAGSAVLYSGSEERKGGRKYSFELKAGRAAFLPSPRGSSCAFRVGPFLVEGSGGVEAAVTAEGAAVFAPFGGVKVNGVETAAGEGFSARAGDGKASRTAGRPALLRDPVTPWSPASHSAYDNSAPEVRVALSYDAEKGTFTADASATRDPDGDAVLRVWWEPVSGPFRPVRDVVGRKFVFAADEGEVAFVCRADDGLLAGKKEIRFRVTGRGENSAPHAAIDGPPVAGAGKPVSFDASRSSDPEGDPLRYRWIFEGGRALSAEGMVGSAVFDRPGVYAVRLVVTDIYGNSAAARRTLRVAADNRPPVASAAARPEKAYCGVPVRLDSSGSYDPEGAPVRAFWSVAEGPPGGTVEDGGDGAVFRASRPGAYRLRLVVSDGENLSEPAYATVEMEEYDGPPRAVAASPVFCTAGETVTLDAERSYCRTGRTLSFAWRFLAGPPCSLHGAREVKAHFVPRMPGVYLFEVEVSDGEETDRAEVEVRAAPSNSPPETGIEGPSRASVGEKVRFRVKDAKDPDGDVLTFFWTVRGPRGFRASGEGSRFGFVPPREGSYDVRVTAWDGFASSKAASIVLTALRSLKKPVVEVKVFPAKPVTHEKVVLSALNSRPGQGGVLSFRWMQTGGPEVELEGAESVVCSFVPKVPGRYSFLLAAAEEGGLTGTREVSFTVRKGNEPPLAVAPSRITVAVGERFELKGSYSYDPDGGKVKGFWSLAPCPAPPWKDRFDSLDVTLTAERAGEYRFVLHVTDGRANATAECTVLCVEKDRAPLRVEPAAAQVEPESEFFAAVSGLREGEGFRCFQLRGHPAAFEATADGVKLHFLFSGTYEFGVVPTGGRICPPAFFMVHVRWTGERLRVECSASRAAAGRKVYLTAVLRGRWKGEPVFEWRQITGPMLEVPRDGGPVLVVVPEKSGVYEFEVSARVDGREAQPGRVRFVVERGAPSPVADAGSDMTATVGHSFTLDASLSKQPGGGEVSFRWRQAAGPEKLMDEARERRVVLTPSVKGLYVFELTVSDGFSSASDRVNVLVRGPNSPPRAEPVSAGLVEAGGLLVLDCSRSKDPDGDPLSYRLEQTAGPPLRAPLRERALPFFVLRPEKPGEYRFRVTVSDGLGGVATAETAVTVTTPDGRADERVRFATEDPMPLAAFLSRAAEAVGKDFTVGDSILRKYYPPGGEPLRVPPVSWFVQKSALPCCIGRLLGAMSRVMPAERGGGRRRGKVMFVRGYSFLKKEESAVRTYPIPGAADEESIAAALEFLNGYLEPALKEGGGMIAAEALHVLADLPLSGHARLARYIEAASPVRPSLPLDFRSSGILADPGGRLVEIPAEAATLADVLRAVEEGAPEVEVCPFLAREAAGVRLKGEAKAALTGGLLPFRTAARRLRAEFPGLVWRVLPGGRVLFTLNDRQLLERSCENVWDCGRVVAAAFPLPAPLPSYSDLAEEIRNADAVLAELWSRRDAGVFCGFDGRRRLVLCNSPAALSYTLEYLWKRVEAEAAGR